MGRRSGLQLARSIANDLRKAGLSGTFTVYRYEITRKDVFTGEVSSQKWDAYEARIRRPETIELGFLIELGDIFYNRLEPYYSLETITQSRLAILNNRGEVVEADQSTWRTLTQTLLFEAAIKQLPQSVEYWEANITAGYIGATGFSLHSRAYEPAELRKSDKRKVGKGWPRRKRKAARGSKSLVHTTSKRKRGRRSSSEVSGRKIKATAHTPGKKKRR